MESKGYKYDPEEYLQQIQQITKWFKSSVFELSAPFYAANILISLILQCIKMIYFFIFHHNNN